MIWATAVVANRQLPIATVFVVAKFRCDVKQLLCAMSGFLNFPENNNGRNL